MKILICGGRDYADARALYAVLDLLQRRHRGIDIIVGDARGADMLALRWSEDRGVAATVCLADWKRYRRSAGHVRNQLMIDMRPDLVVAFPGGRGTADCISRARFNKIPVIPADMIES